MLVSGVLMAVSAGLAAVFAILLVLRNAREFGLVQRPGARSSHLVPTPTGGGLGVVLGGTVAGAFVIAHLAWPALLFAVAGVLVGALGLVDDLRGLPPLARLVAEIALLAAAVCFGMPYDQLPAVLGLPLPVPVVATLVVLAGVYWMNIFNFMDGIDGLAAAEALFLVTAGVGLTVSTGQGILADPYLWWLIGLGAALGVLLAFNWQPARLFMGDIGSLYIGFMIAVLALVSMLAGWLSIWVWLVLTAAFTSDATVTLIRRAAQREALFSAHNRHAYQHLSRRFGSHQRVVLIYLAIDLIWLYPLAWYVHNNPQWGPWTTLIAYAPLVALVFLAGAGRRKADPAG